MHPPSRTSELALAHVYDRDRMGPELLTFLRLETITNERLTAPYDDAVYGFFRYH